MAGVDMVHVPYRGQGPALTGSAWRSRCRCCSPPRPAPPITSQAGKLRASAVTTAAARAEVLPELPTVADFVPGYEASQWYGIGAPKNTPAEIVDKLNREINAAIADPE